MSQLANGKQARGRLAVRTQLRAGFDWGEWWDDVQELGRDLYADVSDLTQSTRQSAQAAMQTVSGFIGNTLSG